MCDWIEANVLFIQGLSKIDVIDILLEEQIYDDQDFAGELIENCWSELLRRELWMKSGYPFRITSQRIQVCRSECPNDIGYAFCLLLSLSESYDWWTKKFGRNYNDQGEFFEIFVQCAMQAIFSNWELYRTGWTRTNTQGLNAVVHEVATRVGADICNLPLWDNYNSKELGLDLLGYRNFSDGRQGNIVYLIQCASGADWKDKLKTPDLEVWRDLVSFAPFPKRAFASPFLFDDETFKRNSIRVNGLLLDRARLFSASNYDEDWLSEDLCDALSEWSSTRVSGLEERSS